MAEQYDNVYFLFNDDDRKTISHLMAQEREALERRIESTQRDLGLVKDAAAVLDEILTLLARMRLIALEAKRPGADREALGAEFEALKDRIDRATESLKGWSPEDAARIQAMLEELEAQGPPLFTEP